MKNKEPESSPLPSKVEDGLNPCPFCGGEAEIKHTGKLQLRIRCKSCYMGLTQKVFRYSLEWLEVRIKENWNKRVASQFKSSPDSPSQPSSISKEEYPDIPHPHHKAPVIATLKPSSISSLEEDAEEIAAIIEGELGYTNGWSISDAEYLKHCMNCAYRIIALLSQKKK